MGDLTKEIKDYVDEVKDLAEDAGKMAKNLAGEAVSKVKDLTDEGGKARELAKNAKGQASAISHGVSEKVQSLLQDTKAGKELKQGITELEALPEIEGSIIYRMELETAISYLRNLSLIIGDKRMDTDSAAEEIRKVMEKVRPADSEQPAETEEQLAIENVKAITYRACTKALEALNVSA